MYGVTFFFFFNVLLCNVNVTVTTTLLLLILLCVSIIYMNNIISEQELPKCNLLTPNSKAFGSNCMPHNPTQIVILYCVN